MVATVSQDCPVGSHAEDRLAYRNCDAVFARTIVVFVGRTGACNRHPVLDGD
jgi:hypothetical protein